MNRSRNQMNTIKFQVANYNTFLIALPIKSRARTFPAFLASSPVKRPIPAPSSSTDFPSYEGSKDRTYRKRTEVYQNVYSWKPGAFRNAFSCKSKWCLLYKKLLSFQATSGPSILMLPFLKNKIEPIQLLIQIINNAGFNFQFLISLQMIH